MRSPPRKPGICTRISSPSRFAREAEDEHDGVGLLRGGQGGFLERPARRGPHELRLRLAVRLARLETQPVAAAALQLQRARVVGLREARVGELVVALRIDRANDHAVVEEELHPHRADDAEPVRAGDGSE